MSPAFGKGTARQRRLGGLLRRLRKAAGLSGPALAGRLKVSQSRVELGEAVATAKLVDRWTRETGASQADRDTATDLTEAVEAEFVSWLVALYGTSLLGDDIEMVTPGVGVPCNGCLLYQGAEAPAPSVSSYREWGWPGGMSCQHWLIPRYRHGILVEYWRSSTRSRRSPSWTRAPPHSAAPTVDTVNRATRGSTRRSRQIAWSKELTATRVEDMLFG